MLTADIPADRSRLGKTANWCGAEITVNLPQNVEAFVR
jgi:hypothetical protein